MEKSSYVIKYTSTFINQFNSILKYLVNKLDNKIAAEKLYNEVIREIEKRSSNPESYEKYIGVRKRKNIYYRIYVNVPIPSNPTPTPNIANILASHFHFGPIPFSM